VEVMTGAADDHARHKTEVEEAPAATTKSILTHPLATTANASAKTLMPDVRGAMIVAEATEENAAGEAIHTRGVIVPEEIVTANATMIVVSAVSEVTGTEADETEEPLATIDDVAGEMEASVVDVIAVRASKRKSLLCLTSSERLLPTWRPSPTFNSVSVA